VAQGGARGLGAVRQPNFNVCAARRACARRPACVLRWCGVAIVVTQGRRRGFGGWAQSCRRLVRQGACSQQRLNTAHTTLCAAHFARPWNPALSVTRGRRRGCAAPPSAHLPGSRGACSQRSGPAQRRVREVREVVALRVHPDVAAPTRPAPLPAAPGKRPGLPTAASLRSARGLHKARMRACWSRS